MRKQTIGFAFPFRAVYGDTAQRKTYGRKIMNKGYIYIMTNPSFKEYVKIGWAANVEQRKRELDFRAGRKAPSDHWVDLGCGVSAGHISLTINVRQNGVGVEFYIPKNKKLYASLLEKKEDIEKDLGFVPEWQPLEEKDASRIIVRNKLGDFRDFDEVTRMKAFKWMKNTAIVMGRTFRKYAKA